MKLMKRDAQKGYVSDMLYVPKSLVNVEGVKSALEFEIPERTSIRMLQLWEESEHHLIVPRAFWNPKDLPLEWIDARPTTYAKTNVRSRVKLDHKLLQDGRVVPTGERIQADAIQAMRQCQGGTLQLACVAGNTEIRLNRAGKGFKMSIAAAQRRFVGDKNTRGPKWDPSIPTYVRANIDGHIGLQHVENIVFRGMKRTYELKLADGKKLRLTADHQVLTTRGFVSIDEGLKLGDMVVTDSGQTKWGKKKVSTRKRKPVYKRLAWYDSHPYAYANGTKYGPRSDHRTQYCLEEHRAIAEARLNKMTLESFRARCRNGTVAGLKFIDPKKFHVHHKDENHKNNSPDNLEVLPIAEHMAEHQPGAAAFGYGVPTPVRLVAITEGRLEKVYDVVCADPHHNFVANGMVVHNCGTGKTVVALHFSALKQVPTLIVVDNTTLLLQWQKEIARHLDVPGGVGLIQGDSRDWQKHIVMATYQTLANWSSTMPEEVRRWFGLVIWDEGHHVSAPTFSKSAPLFYGYRLALTATPSRADGSHVICQHHVGDVLFKHVKQRNPPAIKFKWTGIQLDNADPHVMMAVNDKNGEVHIGKLAGYLGAHRDRLYDHVLAEAKAKVASGHKVLVLSYSVDEVINLMTLWTAGKKDAPLYTDILYPTPAEVGETEAPVELSKSAIKKAHGTIANIRANMRTTQNMPEKKKQQCREHIAKYEAMLQRHEVWKKTESLFKKRQRAFLDELLKKKSTAGLFTAAVDPDFRFKMLKERKVIFAIMKYGREGLDDKDLSAIIVSEPMSDQNILQQVMGRPRGKENAELIFFEDDIGPLIGQCKKLRSHLRYWDASEGGPFKYELENHPAVGRRQPISWTNPPKLRTPGSS
jgi:hypothetical protein